MGYISTGMGDRFSALLVSLMAFSFFHEIFMEFALPLCKIHVSVYFQALMSVSLLMALQLMPLD